MYSKEEKKLKELLFNVKRHTNFGDEIYVLGNIHELGNWKTCSSNKMEWHDYDYWELKISVSSPSFEYKYAVADSNRNIIQWEFGCNRVIKDNESPSNLDNWVCHLESHKYSYDTTRQVSGGSCPAVASIYRCTINGCTDYYSVTKCLDENSSPNSNSLAAEDQDKNSDNVENIDNKQAEENSYNEDNEQNEDNEHDENNKHDEYSSKDVDNLEDNQTL